MLAVTHFTVRSALQQGISRLSDANVPSYALAAELLLMHVLKRDRAWLYGHPEAPIGANAVTQFQDLIEKRASGVPTQYLTGQQEFWGLDFEVTPDVLIPRPETEHLIEAALDALGSVKEHALKIADVGTGSGCIAVSLAKEFPAAEIWATDISTAALAVARRNAARHGVDKRIQFVECNLLSAFEDAPRFEAIVSNPPYVSQNEEAQLQREVREHEPATALFGGISGTEIYGQLIAQAEGKLKQGGFLIVELGYNSLDAVRGILQQHGEWIDIRVINDLAGIPRVLRARRSQTTGH